MIRKSPLIEQSRKENSAEHSWHLAMYALILSGSSNQTIDVNRVIRMLLIHDIVEIDAGDHPIHEAADNENQEALEQQAAGRIFGLLPKHRGEERYGPTIAGGSAELWSKANELVENHFEAKS